MHKAPALRVARIGMAMLGMALAIAAAQPAWATDKCTPIHFDHGTSTATITGSAPADDTVCYTIGTGANQHAELKVVSGDNTVFTIDGLVDAQDKFAFTTQHKTYQIDVGQLNRATDAQAFKISVSVH